MTTKRLLHAAIVVLNLSYSVACSEDDKDKKDNEPQNNSQDGTPQPKVPDGFTVMTPNYLGLKQNAEDSKISDIEFIEQECTGQSVGTFFSFRDDYDSRDELQFCLGVFARPERDNSEDFCIDCKDKIELSNIYVGTFTDKSPNGVADVSFIVVAETDDFIRTNCWSSDFGEDALSPYGGTIVSKEVLEQLLSLQNDSGVCSSTHLVNYQNLQEITMENFWSDRKATFSLTRIELEGR